MEPAKFSLDKFIFNKVDIDLDNNTGEKLLIDLIPSGIFDAEKSIFNLTFNFYAFSGRDAKNHFVHVRCMGTFDFENVNKIEDIPSFFYRNSIAILFPYVRAYISLVTNQANIPALVLPTMNLVSLEKPLKENTTQK